MHILVAAARTALPCLLLLPLNALLSLLSDTDQGVPAGSLVPIMTVQRVEACTLLAPPHTKCGVGGENGVGGGGGTLPDETGGDGESRCVVVANPVAFVIMLLMRDVLGAS